MLSIFSSQSCCFFFAIDSFMRQTMRFAFNDDGEFESLQRRYSCKDQHRVDSLMIVVTIYDAESVVSHSQWTTVYTQVYCAGRLLLKLDSNVQVRCQYLVLTDTHNGANCGEHCCLDESLCACHRHLDVQQCMLALLIVQRSRLTIKWTSILSFIPLSPQQNTCLVAKSLTELQMDCISVWASLNVQNVIWGLEYQVWED